MPVPARKLFRLMNTEPTLSDAAKKAGVSEKTARKYARLRRLPSDCRKQFSVKYGTVMQGNKLGPGMGHSLLSGYDES